jgi:hypothetical protein
MEPDFGTIVVQTVVQGNIPSSGWECPAVAGVKCDEVGPVGFLNVGKVSSVEAFSLFQVRLQTREV